MLNILFSIIFVPCMQATNLTINLLIVITEHHNIEPAEEEEEKKEIWAQKKNAMILTIFYTIHWFETQSALSLHISSPYIKCD